MKLIHALALAAGAASVVGCKSTLDDRWRSDLATTLEDAHFRPVYEVLKDKGIISGEAEYKYTFWGLFGSAPDTFANEIGGPLVLKPGIKEAAFADACKKANCQILLAPRFTITKEVGFLWFSGSNKAVVEGVPAVLRLRKRFLLRSGSSIRAGWGPASAAVRLLCPVSQTSVNRCLIASIDKSG